LPSKTSRRVLAATALASAALALAACGGGDDSTSAGTDDFVTQANAICATTNKALHQLIVETGLDPSKSQLEAYSKAQAQIAEKQINGLAALTAPEDLSEQFDAYIEAQKQTFEDFSQDPNSVGELDYQALDKQADDLGLQAECGSEGDAG